MPSKIPPVRPKKDLIVQLIAECGYETVDAFAAAVPCDPRRITHQVINGTKPCTVETIQLIAATIGRTRKDVKFADLIEKTSLPREDSGDTPTTIPLLDLSLRANVHHSLLPQLSVADLQEKLESALSECAQIIVKELRTGTLWIDLLVDTSTRDEFLLAFFAGRLQVLSVYELYIESPADYRTKIGELFLATHTFASDDMRKQFEQLLCIEGESVAVMTRRRNFVMWYEDRTEMHRWVFGSTLWQVDFRAYDRVWTPPGAPHIHPGESFIDELPPRETAFLVKHTTVPEDALL
ncbi:MAG TPA: hypothetical protein VFE22_03980 [Edaphobacter sp.]|nr:hypothetical protein [Edaphobacter sp.]